MVIIITCVSIAKLKDRCFCYFTAVILASLERAPIRRLLVKLDISFLTAQLKSSTTSNIVEFIY